MEEELSRMAAWEANDGTPEEYEAAVRRERAEIEMWHAQAYREMMNEGW